MYKKYCINKLKNKLQDNIIKEIYRNNDKHFIRNRKMNFEKVILYGLNKRGLTSKMEIEDFTELINTFYFLFLFNTVITGPGHIWLQTMPVYSVANAIRPYIPTGN